MDIKKPTKRKLAPIVIKGFGKKKRGKHPYVDFNPQDTPKKPGLFKEDTLNEVYKIKAKSARTGRVVTHRFKNSDEATKHYRKWLRSGRLQGVSLVHENVLSEKADEYELPNHLIQEVFARGLEDWSEEKPTTQDQWAFARVNSFLEGGRALEMDYDLISEAKEYKITSKTSNKSLGKLANRKDTIGAQARNELARRKKAEKALTYGNKKQAGKKLQGALAGSAKITPRIAQKIIRTLDINPKTSIAKSLNSVAQKYAQEKEIQKQVNKQVKSSEYLKNQKLEAKQRKAREAEDAKHEAEKARIADLAKQIKAEISKELDDVKVKAAPGTVAPPRPYKMPSSNSDNIVNPETIAAMKAANAAREQQAQEKKSVKQDQPKGTPFRKWGGPNIDEPKPKKTIIGSMLSFFKKKKVNEEYVNKFGLEAARQKRYKKQARDPKDEAQKSQKVEESILNEFRMGKRSARKSTTQSASKALSQRQKMQTSQLKMRQTNEKIQAKIQNMRNKANQQMAKTRSALSGVKK